MIQPAPDSFWPAALPVDAAQPWEELNSSGKVIAGINADSELMLGADYYDAGGSFTSVDVELGLTSGAAGSGAVSHGMYRIPLGGAEPGAVSLDANLRLMSNGEPSSYYVGLSEYSAGSWEWHGPFHDSHVRLSPAADVAGGASYTSPLGSLFVTVVAQDGATFDIVAVGVNPYDAGDNTPPDAPILSALTPVAGGLQVEWLHPGAADLAGYRIYLAPYFFADVNLLGVTSIGYLEGNNQHLLSGIDSIRYIRVSAVDFSGNESVSASIVSDSPLAGTAPNVHLTTDEISGLIGASMTLTASGAETYDWDLDGDGVFEVTADAGGSQTVMPGSTGIVRPAVRGLASGGDAFAYGSVSLLLSSNSRPIAQGFADPARGPAPLSVTFTSLSSDFDGTIIRWAWDFDGDKTYDYTTEISGDKDPPPHIYTNPGVYNAKFRAWDDQEAWDVDTVTVVVDPGPDPNPTAVLHASPVTGDTSLVVGFSAADSYDSDGSIVDYEWDFNCNGLFSEPTTEASYQGEPAPTVSYTPGIWPVQVRVTDNNANQDTATITITVHGWSAQTVDWAEDVGQYSSMAVVDGFPAISYYNITGGVLHFVRATNANGSIWSLPVLVDSGADVGRHCCLVVVDGNPAISYYDWTNQDLKYIRATAADGSTWGTPQSLDTTGSVGTYTSMAVVDGNPAISYYDSTNSDLKYVRATDASGTTWGVPATPESTGSVGMHTSLAIVGGNPAIAYQSTAFTLRYVRATDASGSTWGTPVDVDSASWVGDYACLKLVNGYPAISYADTTFGDLKYVRASDANGTTWPFASTVDAGGNVGMYSSMAIVDGFPAISYHDSSNGDLNYIRATDLNGSAWGPKQVPDASVPSVGWYTSLLVVNGSPAISHYDITNGDLKYSRLY